VNCVSDGQIIDSVALNLFVSDNNFATDSLFNCPRSIFYFCNTPRKCFSNCYGNGLCGQDGVCSCFPGYGGKFCESYCLNGICAVCVPG
jgi:hypothetical protein